MDGKQLLKQLAPTAASFLFGPAAGVLVEAAGKALGIEQPTIEQIRDTVRKGDLTGEQIENIRKLEIEAQSKEKELGLRAEELIVSDRIDARKMQAATQSKMPAILTVIITVGFFGTLATMFYMPQVKDSAPLMIMLGQLSAGWAAAIAFYFGTTSGSKAKTDLLAQSTPAK